MTGFLNLPNFFNIKVMYPLIDSAFIKRIKHIFVSTLAKPQCDNVMQPDPRSGEGCNTLFNKGFANVDTRKRMLYRHCYIPSLQAQCL